MSPTILIAIAASGAGAFVGGYVLIHPEGGAGLVGFRGEPRGEGLRALGGAMLLGHAAALVVMAQAPGVGACFAAGLGTAWFGAAAGRAISGVVELARGPKLFVRIASEAAMGAVLWAPLWGYLKLIRRGAGDV